MQSIKQSDPEKIMSKNQTDNNNAASRQPSLALPGLVSAPDPAAAATSAAPPAFVPLAGESDRAFAAFRVYLELGPRRRFLAAARQVGVTLRTIQRWANDFDWRGRIQTHAAAGADQFARAENSHHREQFQDTAARAKNFHERQYALADAILDLSERYLERLEVADLDQLRLTDACRALDFASRIVRETRRAEAAAAPDRGLHSQITALLDRACRENAATTAANNKAGPLHQTPSPVPTNGNQPTPA